MLPSRGAGRRYRVLWICYCRCAIFSIFDSHLCDTQIVLEQTHCNRHRIEIHVWRLFRLSLPIADIQPSKRRQCYVCVVKGLNGGNTAYGPACLIVGMDICKVQINYELLNFCIIFAVFPSDARITRQIITSSKRNEIISDLISEVNQIFAR